MERAATDPRENRFDGLHAEAKAALGYSANSLRAVRDRYREAHQDELGRWHRLRDELDRIDRADGAGASAPEAPTAAEAAEAGAADARIRELRRTVERVTTELGMHQQELAKLELAARTLESTWLFLERGDSSLLDGAAAGGLPADERMRIVEAQEAERSRLAQEVHDGPARALSNAIFQAEYIERVLESDPPQARAELQQLRDALRRELADVRTFISQLRPPIIDEVGLDGALRDAVASAAAMAGIPIDVELDGSPDGMPDAAKTVALRIVGEALENVRKHAAATSAAVRTSREGREWTVEVHDDGRGFEVGAVAARGRRNFGLQFMRERADLVGARFEVRSRPDGGTVVRLAIPTGGEEVG
ncbi:MAG TPA: sensor histidine kinase [Candidatus Limnocylindrales bacterium]|nr:sensor histidine kinase [Candidatus Limnocylindrales bacterium]